MKESFLKFVVQAVWRRRKLVYYAVSVVSIAGNLIVLAGPTLQASIVLRSGALQAAWSAVPHVAEVVLHRSVLYILLNLIVARILVKSGMLGRQTPAKPDEFCSPSSYHVVRGLPWPAVNSYIIYGTQSDPGMQMVTNPSLSLRQGHCEDQNRAVVADVCVQTPTQKHPNINKSCDDEQPKRVLAPSLFTIEPLNELVQTTESYTICDDEAHIDKNLLHPLRKVASRAVNLHRSMEAHAGTFKNSMKKENEESLQLVLAKQDGDVEKANGEGEHDDSLSRQEFNERVDTFISKFKRNLTMQRQDSLNRLLGLVGGLGTSK